jgi:nanoRNase/pAp phosphatase (c-di-AMP/oligoRNAs hydrolase)
MKICWTHYDLDGISSYLVLKWFHPKEVIELRTSQSKNFCKDWKAWINTVDISKYEKIYILDLDVYECIELIDKENVLIIDHHETHFKEIEKYKKATALIKIYSSAAKLCYKIFSKLYPDIQLTDAQKKLIVLADDYDSYALQLEDSKKLNDLFWNTQKAQEEFIKWFINGFNGFNHQHITIIKQYENRLHNIKESLKVYSANIKIQNKIRKVCAAFSTTAINDVADILKKEYGADLAIVVNTKSKSVSFRIKDHTSDLDVSVFAEKIADGGGHKYAAGGKITESFMEFTKILKPIN